MGKRAVVASMSEAPSKGYWEDGLSTSAALPGVVLVANEFWMTINPAVDGRLQTLATWKN